MTAPKPDTAIDYDRICRSIFRVEANAEPEWFSWSRRAIEAFISSPAFADVAEKCGYVTESENTEALKERDDTQDKLNELAEAVSAYFKEDIGEWSSSNDPADNAIDMLESNEQQLAELQAQFDALQPDEGIVRAHGKIMEENAELAKENADCKEVLKNLLLSCEEYEKALLNDGVISLGMSMRMGNYTRQAQALLASRPSAPGKKGGC